MSLNDIYKQVFYRGQPAMGSSDIEDVLGDKIAESDIKAGDFITMGSSNGYVKPVSSSGDVIIGMAIFRPQQMVYSQNGQAMIKAGEMVPYIKSGLKIKLLVDVAISKGDKVYVSASTGNLTNVATGNIQLGNSVFEDAVNANSFANVSFSVL